MLIKTLIFVGAWPDSFFYSTDFFFSIIHFLQLQAHTQEAKVVALSSVVTGKEVESDANALHRKAEGETLPTSVFA